MSVSPRLACSKRSDSGERCEVKKAMKSRGELGREVLPRFYFFALLFTSHRSPLSERLEQASPRSKLAIISPYRVPKCDVIEHEICEIMEFVKIF